MRDVPPGSGHVFARAGQPQGDCPYEFPPVMIIAVWHYRWIVQIMVQTIKDAGNLENNWLEISESSMLSFLNNGGRGDLP